MIDPFLALVGLSAADPDTMARMERLINTHYGLPAKRGDDAGATHVEWMPGSLGERYGLPGQNKG